MKRKSAAVFAVLASLLAVSCGGGGGGGGSGGGPVGVPDPVRIETRAANGELMFARSFTYDSKGRILTIAADDDGDGILDMMLTNTYDANGLHSSALEFDADGPGASLTAYTTDAKGNILTSGSDANADGVADFVSNTYTYDAADNMLTNTYDTGWHIVRFTFTHDAAGNMLTQAQDTHNDGSIEWRAAWTYDTHGSMLTSSVDTNNDGVWDIVNGWVYTYDSKGRLATEKYDELNDGSYNWRLTCAYGANGGLATRTKDYDLDGTPEETTTWYY